MWTKWGLNPRPHATGLMLTMSLRSKRATTVPSALHILAFMQEMTKGSLAPSMLELELVLGWDARRDNPGV